MTDNLKYRIEHVEIPPPAEAWSNIAVAVTEWEDTKTIGKKLESFEVTVPENTWMRITAALDAGLSTTAVEAPVRSMRRFPILRVAAAVILIALLIPALFKFFQSAPTIMATIKNAPATTSHFTLSGDHANTGAIPQPQHPDLSIQSRRLGNARILSIPAPKREVAFANVETSNWLPEEARIAVKVSPIRNIEGGIMRDIGLLDNYNSGYLAITGPNGEMTRISSKFANAISYLNGEVEKEEYFDKVIRESTEWKQRFNDWRNKILSSSYLPASGNFLDIVEFTDFLRKNQ